MADLQVSDVFGGTSSQELGEERGDDVVFSVCLKRVRYCCQATDSHLQWIGHKVKTLRAGSITKLVEHLAPYQDHVDVSYRTCFLCTYRTFSTAGQVLQLLKERHAAMAPLVGDSVEVVEAKRAVQSAIISFLHVWLESYSFDFYSPPSHPTLDQLESSFCQHTTDSVCELAGMLKAVRRDFEKKALYTDSLFDDLTHNSSCGGEAIDQQLFDVFKLSAEEFAQALTAKDAHIFQQVVPHQCLAYTRNPKKSHAPTIHAAIEHFNRVSLVVIATILGGGASSSMGRAQVVTQWIDIAQQCRMVKNFSSLKAIVSGMQSSAIFRLSRSWEEVPVEKMSLFKELSDVFTTDDNHQTSRVLLNREGTGKYVEVASKKSKAAKNGVQAGTVQGVVPYLGTFLTDLTMIHTAHSDVTKDGLLNFDKHRKAFEILVQLTLYQKAAANYSFPRHAPLERWLSETPLLSEQESFELSKQLEPNELLSEDSTDHGLFSTLPPASRITKTLRHLFLSKGTAVGDSSSPQTHRLTPSLSDRDIRLSTEKEPKSQSSSTSLLQVNGRSSSLSPSLGRKMATGNHIVRVAMSNNDSCMYKSILLSESDKTSTVIRNALEKHGLHGNSSYTLSQLLDRNRKLEIPEGANVFYALTGPPEEATLLLEVKTEMNSPCR